MDVSFEQVRIQELLRELSQRKVSELEDFSNQLTKLIERKKSPEFEKEEQQLMEEIQNGGPSAEFWTQYEKLAEKSDDKILTPDERKEFRQAIQVTREWDLERLKLMLALAELWNTSLDNVRIRLNINTKETTDV